MGGNQSVRTQTIGIFIAALALVGCGGGGGSGVGSGGATTPPAPKAPEVTLTPQATKQFVFSWDDVDGEAEYRLLENPDGMSGYTEVAVIPADAQSYSHPVFLPERVNASYILQACDADGDCLDFQEVFVTGSLAEAVGYVKASNPGVADRFGVSVAISGDGNTLVVGADGEDSSAPGVDGNQDDDLRRDSGAVYVFERSENGWRQQAYIKAFNTGTDDYFGFSVALSDDGNTLAVGAWGDDGGFGRVSGAVYVFTRENAVWIEQAYVKAFNPDAYDQFGRSVALSGDGSTLAVGAPDEDGSDIGVDGEESSNSAISSGAVYVFARENDFWSRQAYVKASNTDNSDRFGMSVALSNDGHTLAVGAEGEDSSGVGIDGDGNESDNSASRSGAVYVFARDNGTWSQQAYVKASDTASGDRFGSSVSLSGDGSTLSVGARGEFDPALISIAASAAGTESNSAASSGGAVYVFTRENAVWNQQARLAASNPDEYDGFGTSVSLSDDGRTLAVAASSEASSAIGINGDENDNLAEEAGAVYVFAASQGLWAQIAYVKAPNTEAFDGFGSSVGLSGDGDILAVGSRNEGSGATGINGDQSDNSVSGSGSVYLY